MRRFLFACCLALALPGCFEDNEPEPEGDPVVDGGLPPGQICRAGETTCDDRGRLRTCLETGDGWLVERCEGMALCLDGACVEQVCAPYETRCVDAGAVESCAADGTGWVEPRDCAEGESCADGRCLPPICDPGEILCGSGVLLTCAGTESVLRVDRRGGLLAHHWLREGAFEDAYPGIDDFRLVDHDALKPHSHHPNHAVRHEGELWVTCFETQACHGLAAGGRIALPEAIPHDGRPRQGLLWFTQVTGRVVAVDPRTGERALELDLRALRGTRHMLGWCRGLEVVGSRLFVGMTVLRATRHREVLRQLLLGEAGTKLPTRLVEIDLDGPRIVREIPLGNEAGGTIYGVLHVG